MKKTKKITKKVVERVAKKTKAPKKSKSLKRIKLAPVPLTESQITAFLDYYKVNKSFPGSKVPCNITGKLSTCTGPWLKKKIEEYGGPENFLRKYRCRGALTKAKKIAKGPKKPKKDRVPKVNGKYIIPEMKHTPVRVITTKELIDISKNICMRPDIYLNNNRSCENCMHFTICENHLKCLADPRKVKFVPKIRMFTNVAAVA